MRRNYTHAIYFGKNHTHINKSRKNHTHVRKSRKNHTHVKKSRKNHTHLIQIPSKTYSFLCLESNVQSVYNPSKVFSSCKYILEWG